MFSLYIYLTKTGGISLEDTPHPQKRRELTPRQMGYVLVSIIPLSVYCVNL